MLRSARSLDDLTLLEVQWPRSTWSREGWTDATTLPLKKGRFRLRLRHSSGGFPPLDVQADWNGAAFVQVRPDPFTAIPGSLQAAADALFERPEVNRGQWDLTAWVRDDATGEQPAVVSP